MCAPSDMRPVIILVPGFRDDTRVLGRLERRLMARGATVRSISPQPSSGEVELQILAQQLAADIEANCEQAPIHLFGFSMGGLICRYYVQRLGGAKHVARLVTLATPHYGSWSSYMMRDRPACIQMRPGSAFLRNLNADLAILARLDSVSIWTPFDLSILPPTSSCLPIGRNIRILSPFHGTLLFDPRVLDSVSKALVGEKIGEVSGKRARSVLGAHKQRSEIAHTISDGPRNRS